jgi:hypothetical protein
MPLLRFFCSRKSSTSHKHGKLLCHAFSSPINPLGTHTKRRQDAAPPTTIHKNRVALQNDAVRRINHIL